MVWRIRRPVAYPIWLPVIFFAVPAVLASALLFLWPIPFDLLPVVMAFLLHSVIAACYTCGYAGIIEYSPSAEIMRVVQSNMPEGTPQETLQVTSLSEESLTGKRVRHLLASGMINCDSGLLMLAKRGRYVVVACLVYRSIFGIQEEARG